MKTLYLLRHAKSSHHDSDLTDFDRPLSERGYADAHIVSKHLALKKIRIDVLISSPAIRALTTALIFAGNLNYPVEKILLRPQLYNAGVHNYLACIESIRECNSLLIVGHNESISELAKELSLKPFNSLKTCSLVSFQLNINSWKNIQHSKGNLTLQVNPALVKGELN